MATDYYSEAKWGAVELRKIPEQRERIVTDWLAQLNVTKPAALLDLGCGDGFFLSHVAERFPAWKLAGADGSEAVIRQARRRLPGIKLEITDANKPLPFADESFDVVYSGEVIEHLTDPDQLLAEAKRILKPGGYLILTTPNLLAWYNRVLMLLGCSPLFVEYSVQDASVGYGLLKKLQSSTMPVGHLRIFHAAALLDLLALCGFANPRLKSARFERLPRTAKLIESILARVFPRAGSILISVAQKR